jgi:hypothetical protein
VQSSWQIARRGDVVKRSARVSLVVGSLLCVINHGDILLAGQLSDLLLVKIGLTYLVPYCVATYGAVGAFKTAAP